mgnify:CR=1 FL=1
MNALFLERFQIVEASPAALLDAAATTGDFVSLKHAVRAVVVFVSGVGTAGDDPVLSLFQAQDVSGTGVQDLNPPSNSTFQKQAATDLSAVAAWTDASGDISANDVTNATAAEQSLIWVVEIRPDELDVDDGYDCIRADVNDVGTNAQPGYLFYIIELKEQRAPANAVSVIAD